MSYSLDIDPSAQAVIAVLPGPALQALAEVFAALELSPWMGRSINPENPDGPVRLLVFGDGLGVLTYLVLEREQRIDVLLITWVG